MACSSLVGYDIEQVVSTKIYSLLPADRCTPETMQSTNVTSGGLVLHAPEVDIDLSFCMFSASYVVWGIAHSARLDDATYLTEDTRVIPTYYALDTWTCRAIWTNQKFKLPGFAEKEFSLSKEDLIVDGREIRAGEQKSFSFSETFFRKGKKVGIRWAAPIDWNTPLGARIKGAVVINGKLVIGKIIASLDKTSKPWSLVLTDPHNQKTSCMFPGSDFVYDSVVYLPHFYGQCEMKSLFLFDKYNSGVIIKSDDADYISGETSSGENSRVFYVELLNTTITVCSYRVRPTTYTGVYLIVEDLREELPKVDFDVDAIPNLVYGTKIEFVHVNAHLSRQRIAQFIKAEICKTRQMILNGLISLASNLDNPNLFLGSGSMVGVHAEKAGAVLYVHKCAKIPVQITDFAHCTEEVPVLLENSTTVKFMNPITQVVYPNYTLTSCDPIAPYMYRTNEGIWMHYGLDHSVARSPESLSVFSHLDFVDQLPSLHTAGLFSYENLRQSARARVRKYSRRTIAGREVYLEPGNFYSHPDLMRFNPDIRGQLSVLPTWQYLEEMENLAASGWHYAEQCTLAGLTFIALISFFVFLLKVCYSIRLLTYGVPYNVVVGLLNPFSSYLDTLNSHRTLLQSVQNNRIIEHSVENNLRLKPVSGEVSSPPASAPMASLYPIDRIVAIQTENNSS